jgi:cholesterol oxidase
MLGCKYNAKNTLDKNYLYLAQKLGVKIIAESEVYDVVPNGTDGSKGYTIKYRDSLSWFPKKGTITSKGVIFSGGVLGTVKLLLALKEKSLPNLSEKVGYGIRTNSEALFGVTSLTKDKSYSEGIAIGSILHTDDHSHIEVVRYAAGSGFFRMFMAPMVAGKTIFTRFLKMVKDAIVHPISNFKVLFTDDWSKRTIVLLFMQSIDSTLRFKKGLFGLTTNLDKGPAPTSFIPEAQDLATRYGKLMNGKPMVMNTESLFGIPTTAHILGGACMGNDVNEGVIDKNNMVFGYKNMMVCDGSMISANPGVNPSLSITAISELAMSKVVAKNEIM